MSRYGIVLRKCKLDKLAASVLLESVRQYEYNWSAWMELGSLATTRKNVSVIFQVKHKCILTCIEKFLDLQTTLAKQMKDSIMKDLFLARLALEMHLPSDTFWELMRPLAGCFPNSIYIKSQLAAACYDMFGK